MALCFLLPLNVGYTADGKTGKPSTNLPAMNFTDVGEWRTKENTSPKISILFYDRGYQVIINEKPIKMTGGRIRKSEFGTGFFAFFHFQNLNSEGPHGGESYMELGLVDGMMGSQEVLSGFYSERDHDSQDRIVRGFYVPVVLYPVRTGK